MHDGAPADFSIAVRNHLDWAQWTCCLAFTLSGSQSTGFLFFFFWGGGDTLNRWCTKRLWIQQRIYKRKSLLLQETSPVPSGFFSLFVNLYNVAVGYAILFSVANSNNNYNNVRSPLFRHWIVQDRLDDYALTRLKVHGMYFFILSLI